MTLPSGIQPGDVYSIFDYEFGNQQTADSKYYVVMGCREGHVAGFVTTSQEKLGRTRKEGCRVEYGRFPSNYFLKTSAKPFKEGTWVLLWIEWQDGQALAQRIAAGKAVRVHTFADPVLRALRNCFESSPDWADACKDYMYPANCACAVKSTR